MKKENKAYQKRHSDALSSVSMALIAASRGRVKTMARNDNLGMRHGVKNNKW